MIYLNVSETIGSRPTVIDPPSDLSALESRRAEQRLEKRIARSVAEARTAPPMPEFDGDKKVLARWLQSAAGTMLADDDEKETAAETDDTNEDKPDHLLPHQERKSHSEQREPDRLTANWLLSR